MIQNEKILALVMLGIILSTFSALSVQYSIQHEENKDKPIQMVNLDGNTTTRYEIQPPPSPPAIIVGMMGASMKLAFALPFALSGFSIFVGFIGLYETGFDINRDIYHYAIYWTLSIISIPITFYLSREMPLWRRIPYIYFIAGLISGIPIMLSENFGQ